MRLSGISFKCSAEVPIGIVAVALVEAGLRLDGNQKHRWSRSVGDHLFRVEYREKMSNKERSFLWVRWLNPNGLVDKSGLERVLSEWFFIMSQTSTVTVYWMHAILEIDEFRPLYGYKETTPKIWTKTDEHHHRFSFFPVQGHYHFEVRKKDGKRPIQHHRFSFWLDELKFNLLGYERPDDQIAFDMVG